LSIIFTEMENWGQIKGNWGQIKFFPHSSAFAGVDAGKI